jgi:hypothetical protein
VAGVAVSDAALSKGACFGPVPVEGNKTGGVVDDRDGGVVDERDEGGLPVMLELSFGGWQGAGVRGDVLSRPASERAAVRESARATRAATYGRFSQRMPWAGVVSLLQAMPHFLQQKSGETSGSECAASGQSVWLHGRSDPSWVFGVVEVGARVVGRRVASF